MDIINEVWDTYFGDYFYAWILPVQPTSYGSSNDPNDPTPEPPWQYKPATKLISFEPSDAAYQSVWARNNIYRQAINVYLITWIFGLVMYLVFASLSYIFIFDKTTFNHPRYLKNQIRREIRQASAAMPVMAILTVPFLLAELRHYTRTYDTTEDGPGLWYDMLQIPLFVIFSDFCIYWIHRGLHHPLVYRRLHKPHHQWIITTPFASYAFHPLDGWAQSLPYHIFPLLFPMQKFVYVGAFVFVNFWAIMIHDGEFLTNNPVINGAACHSMHHLYFNYNYGQYTTFWDRMGGSYREPDQELIAKTITKRGQKIE
ncbi:hypothetical protein BX600DRAFT_66858 [Xylariales sp. PMI_506]|nr:hypothetical protein BX600DRAFT_66858 [Xylariales sp. PMI_506]